MHQVTVIVAAWNASGTLKRCVESVIAQEGVNVELIIVNDCSADDTHALINQLAKRYSNIVQASTTRNSGPSVARNLGLELATTEWVAIVDADDTIAPNRLIQLIQAAEANDADICFDNLKIIQAIAPSQHKDNALLVPMAQTTRLTGRWTVKSYTSLNLPYVSPVLIGYLKPLIRRKFIQETKLRYNNQLKNGEDYLLILESIIRGANIIYLDAALYNYYVYKSSLSGQFDVAVHKKLIAAEQTLLETYRTSLSAIDAKAIASHLQSLYLAGVTNEIFSALRSRRFDTFVKTLWADRPHVFLHMWRITKAIAHKFLGLSYRGV